MPFSLVVIRGPGCFELTAREPTIYYVVSLFIFRLKPLKRESV